MSSEVVSYLADDMDLSLSGGDLQFYISYVSVLVLMK